MTIYIMEYTIQNKQNRITTVLTQNKQCNDETSQRNTSNNPTDR